MKELEKQINDFVGRKISAVRATLGITQKVLGKELNVAPQQIQKYEQGDNRLSVAKLFLLAQAVNVPIQYFFPHNDNQTEAAQPKTVPVIRIMNHIPSRYYDDVVNILRSIARISTVSRTENERNNAAKPDITEDSDQLEAFPNHPKGNVSTLEPKRDA